MEKTQEMQARKLLMFCCQVAKSAQYDFVTERPTNRPADPLTMMIYVVDMTNVNWKADAAGQLAWGMVNYKTGFNTHKIALRSCVNKGNDARGFLEVQFILKSL